MVGGAWQQACPFNPRASGTPGGRKASGCQGGLEGGWCYAVGDLVVLGHSEQIIPVKECEVNTLFLLEGGGGVGGGW